MDFDFIPNPQHYIRFGANLSYHLFSPGVSQNTSSNQGVESTSKPGNERIRAIEGSVYVEDDWSLSSVLKANIGLHGSLFRVKGKTFYSLQPRIGLRYLLSNDIALKTSFVTMTQYLHLLSNEGVGLPTDLWLPATPEVIPEQSWQVSLGLAKTIDKNIELSIEGCFKQMGNLISYVEGASFSGSLFGDDGTNWEQEVVQGTGTSYGVELFLQKKVGKTTGWLAYTWSKNNRAFEEINNGQTYPFKYDRRHDVSLAAMHQLNDCVSVSATWVYGTGNAISLPVSKHQPYAYQPIVLNALEGGIEELEVSATEFEAERAAGKNNYRMRAYHRLDVSIAFKKRKKKFKKQVEWQRTWVFGAYNAYSRANPFFIARSFNNSTDDNLSLRQFSLFPIVPFINYQFKF